MVAAYYACKRALVGGPREPRAQHQTKPGANMLEPMVTRPHDLDPPPVAGASGDTAAPVLELSADNSMPLPWAVGAHAAARDSQVRLSADNLTQVPIGHPPTPTLRSRAPRRVQEYSKFLQ